jgi:hypothetical protein
MQSGPFFFHTLPDEIGCNPFGTGKILTVRVETAKTVLQGGSSTHHFSRSTKCSLQRWFVGNILSRILKPELLRAFSLSVGVASE